MVLVVFFCLLSVFARSSLLRLGLLGFGCLSSARLLFLLPLHFLDLVSLGLVVFFCLLAVTARSSLLRLGLLGLGCLLGLSWLGLSWLGLGSFCTIRDRAHLVLAQVEGQKRQLRLCWAFITFANQTTHDINAPRCDVQRST